MLVDDGSHVDRHFRYGVADGAFPEKQEFSGPEAAQIRGLRRGRRRKQCLVEVIQLQSPGVGDNVFVIVQIDGEVGDILSGSARGDQGVLRLREQDRIQSGVIHLVRTICIQLQQCFDLSHADGHLLTFGQPLIGGLCKSGGDLHGVRPLPLDNRMNDPCGADEGE